MANLGTFTIKATEHVNVETATGLTFTQGNKYRLQSYDGAFWLREGTTGKGDYVQPLQFGYYTDNGNDLYVLPSSGTCTLNIADYTEESS